MPIGARSLALVILSLLATTACAKDKPLPLPVPDASAAPEASVPEASAPDASAPPKPPPQGTATLVLQKVYADCGVGGWAGTNERQHLLGTDVFVTLQGEDAKAKPEKEFAFCASHDKDGKARKPQLQTWQNCSSFVSCRVLDAEGGAEDRVEVQCGKERVTVESDGTHTVLRGSFGERELAPHPMKIAPVKSDVRRAMVDC